MLCRLLHGVFSTSNKKLFLGWLPALLGCRGHREQLGLPSMHELPRRTHALSLLLHGDSDEVSSIE
jgi:hypothetical protein